MPCQLTTFKCVYNLVAVGFDVSFVLVGHVFNAVRRNVAGHIFTVKHTLVELLALLAAYHYRVTGAHALGMPTVPVEIFRVVTFEFVADVRIFIRIVLRRNMYVLTDNKWFICPASISRLVIGCIYFCACYTQSVLASGAIHALSYMFKRFFYEAYTPVDNALPAPSNNVFLLSVL